jgi:large subunit ribosomal protein L25
MALKTTITIAAARRSDTGKGNARQLRLNGKLPAVIYGRGREPESLTLGQSDYDKAMAGHSGASILDLNVDGKSVKALVREVQRHPVTRKVSHVDFYEIHEGVSLTVSIPIHIEGLASGVKNQGGVLDQTMREVQIEVLPRYIPEQFVVDVTALEIGGSIHLRDLQIENVKFLGDVDATVCTVAAPRVEEVVATPDEDEEAIAGEPTVIGKEDEDGAEASGDS